MKIFKVKTMHGSEIPIDEQELEMLTAAIRAGARCVVVGHGVIFPSSIDSIVLHRELMETFRNRLEIKKDIEIAKNETLGLGAFYELKLKLKDQTKMLK